MSLKTSTLLLTVVYSQSFAQDAPVPWAREVSAAQWAFHSGKYAVAARTYGEALAKAELGGAQTPAILPLLKSFAAALRTNGDPAGAQQIIERMLGTVKEVSGENSVETAALLSELAVAQRAQDLRKEAISSLQQAIRIRRAFPITEQLASDTTLVGTIFHEMGDDDQSGIYYQTALFLWGDLRDSGLQILTALEPLADLRRNQNDYKRAEELYMWALRLREAAMGPKDPELISTLDSLSYALFGLKKYDEAEVMYKRLLELWEMVGGAEHPMLALTLDKMAEFYIEQKRYDEAEPIAQRSLSIRTKATMETLHRTGRVLTGQRKIEEATELYGRALRMAADARVPDEDIPGTLRAYALLLRQTRRDKEADSIESRLKEGIEKKAEKDGKRPKPQPLPHP